MSQATYKWWLVIMLLTMQLVAQAALRTPVQYENDIRAAFRYKNWKGGKALLDEAEPEYGTLSVFCELNGAYYYHMQKYDEARRYLLLALRDDEANTQALELLVRLEQETGNYSTAISHINKLLEFSPYNARLWRKMIDLYRLDGNDYEANRLLERLHNIYPEDDTINKAVLYLEQVKYYEYHRAGNRQAEEESLKRILTLDPKNKEANRALDALIRRKYNKIFARDKRNEAAERRYQDSLNVIRTANLSATKVMEAIYAKEKEEREYVDPEVLAAQQHRDSVEQAERARLRFMGDAVDSSYVYLKRHEAAKVVPLMDSVLELDPKHNEARMLLSNAYEQLHQWDLAYYYRNGYHPLPEEVFSIRRQLHALAMRSHHNDLSVEYQYARRSSKDELTHNAYLHYTHSWKRDDLTFHAAYAGRESYTEEMGEDSVQILGGGTGVQLGAEYAHHFDSLPTPFTLTLQGSWSNRFFPQWTASIAFQEELPKDWTFTQRFGWRRINDFDTKDNYHLLSLDLMLSKELGHFILIPTFNTYAMLTSRKPSDNFAWGTPIDFAFFFNGSLKMQYFPIDGDRSNVFASVGAGNAPESQLLSNSMPVQFARLNTFVSGGVYWVFTDNLGASFSTSWYTQEQRISTTPQQHKSITRNYLYINASLQISF